MDDIDNSHSLDVKSGTVSKKEISEQKHLLERWPAIQKQLASPTNFELKVPNSLKNNIAEQKAQGKVAYTKLIRNLSQEGNESGKQWLKSISENVRNVFVEEIKKGKI